MTPETLGEVKKTL